MTPLSEVSTDDLGREALELLPERAALGLIDITTIVPINIAIAINAASVGSTAVAGALQGVRI
jgi:hypothetical protein